MARYRIRSSVAHARDTSCGALQDRLAHAFLHDARLCLQLQQLIRAKIATTTGGSVVAEWMKDWANTVEWRRERWRCFCCDTISRFFSRFVEDQAPMLWYGQVQCYHAIVPMSHLVIFLLADEYLLLKVWFESMVLHLDVCRLFTIVYYAVNIKYMNFEVKWNWIILYIKQILLNVTQDLVNQNYKIV